MKNYVFGILILLAGILSCSKDDIQVKPDDYFIFGSTGDRGGGIVAYKLHNDELFKDDIEKIWEPLRFSSKPLDQEKTNIASSLFEKYQTLNLDPNTKIFGCPNCADQGTYFIKVFKDGILYEWYFDTDDNALSGEALVFSNEIESILSKLN